MPSYDFYNSKTNEVEEHKMSYKELDSFLESNPHLTRHHSTENLPSFGDGVRMSVPGIGQPVREFEQGVIERIKRTVPGNTLHKSHKTKLPREW